MSSWRLTSSVLRTSFSRFLAAASRCIASWPACIAASLALSASARRLTSSSSRRRNLCTFASAMPTESNTDLEVVLEAPCTHVPRDRERPTLLYPRRDDDMALDNRAVEELWPVFIDVLVELPDGWR